MVRKVEQMLSVVGHQTTGVIDRGANMVQGRASGPEGVGVELDGSGVFKYGITRLVEHPGHLAAGNPIGCGLQRTPHHDVPALLGAGHEGLEWRGALAREHRIRGGIDDDFGPDRLATASIDHGHTTGSAAALDQQLGGEAAGEELYTVVEQRIVERDLHLQWRDYGLAVEQRLGERGLGSFATSIEPELLGTAKVVAHIRPRFHQQDLGPLIGSGAGGFHTGQRSTGHYHIHVVGERQRGCRFEDGGV